MIIQRAKKVRTGNLSEFAWSSLRKFQNIDLLAKILIEMHQVPAEYHDDARKQAQQIRYCLIQAREYFAAASSVSTATRPNLLYYGTMSLALAEILFKQSGDSSLDRAREENRHHGLTMTVGSTKRGVDLSFAAHAIRARPHEVDGKRHGTFELWHKSSRETPLPGSVTTHLQTGGSTLGYRALFHANDIRFPSIPRSGLTLADCFSNIPLMMDHLAGGPLTTNLIRGFSTAVIRQGPQWEAHYSIIVHPSGLYDQLLNNLLADPNAVDRIDVHEAGPSATITIRHDWVCPSFHIPIPAVAAINTSEWRMWTNSPPLNELGYLYVAIYLAGNYARYFPDKWLIDVETSTPLALAIEELCSICEWRVPWLSLSELDQTLYVPES